MHDKPSAQQLSDALIAAIRTSDYRGYAIAYAIGVSPSQLSAWVNRIQPVRADDARVRKLAALMGVETSDAFRPWRSTTPSTVGTAGVEFRGGRRDPIWRL
ncbi:MAG: hypothetical protein DMF84_22105 [Acidobacteria bacterium]|nr:MAG: hypothetical protein DMF84_22105 [Acidobacteriota bacterium]